MMMMTFEASFTRNSRFSFEYQLSLFLVYDIRNFPQNLLVVVLCFVKNFLAFSFIN